jgi:hypothetical protein
MAAKRTNPHKNFMVFNAVLFFAVLFITALFLYLAYTFKRDADKVVSYKGRYHIEVSTDFAGEGLSIYVNDSLLLDGTMPDTLVSLDVNRFAEEHALLIVDKQTDIVTPFNLSKEGGKVIIKKEGSKIMMEETPSRF